MTYPLLLAKKQERRKRKKRRKNDLIHFGTTLNTEKKKEKGREKMHEPFSPPTDRVWR